MDKFEEVDLSMNNTNISISIIPKIDKYTTDSGDEPKTKKINPNQGRRETISFLNKITINFGDITIEQIKNQKKLYGDNRITTTKYNILTWFPKSLLMQFMRIANIYFLIVTILTLMPFSPKNPYTQVGTFAFVLIFTMLKEAYEDYKRYQQDNMINNKITEVYDYRKKIFISSIWSNLKPGDIVKIKKDNPIPADLLILNTSSSNGLCFVDTKDLDGETNLKEKMVCPDFLKIDKNDLINMTGHFQCDLPNEYMDSWEGTIFSKNLKFFTNANIKNLLLKGSILKNTQEVLCLVIYTGFNTKIMKNAKNPPIKMSNVMKTMNSILISVFIFQTSCCAVFSYAFLNFTEKNEKYLKFYINEQNSPNILDFFVKFLTFFVAFSHLIPISLYVVMEIVKILQSWFIFYDNLMFDAVSNKPAIARTSELIEELGQVEFIFSDKTGTLTVNKMDFKNCYIGGVIFGKEDEKNLENKNKLNIKKNFEKKKSITIENIYSNFLTQVEKNGNLNSELNFCGDNRIPKILSLPLEKNIFESQENNNLDNNTENLDFIKNDNEEILNYLDIESSINISAMELKRTINNFFRVCTLCHSAICENDKDGNLSYASSSPEEITFLNGSKKTGFCFQNRTSNMIEIFNNYKNVLEEWEILLEIPFESDRKRMTLVLKEKNDVHNTVHILIKGADEALIPLIHLNELTKISLEDALKYFSCQGLRTLIINKKYKEAFLSRDKKKILEEIYAELETNFSLAGVCAIEDQLQQGVPETIEMLLKSNIRETALNIGRTCRLIEEIHTNEIRLCFPEKNFFNCSHKSYLEEIIDNYLNEFKIYDVKDFDEIMQKKLNQNYYMVISGEALIYIFKSDSLSLKFFKLGLICRSVICCRVSAKQKSQVVKLVKSMGPWVTLAVGDGTNDVPMIMEANIGVGIQGVEGTQAVRSADYGICQFKYLQRLVLVHGRNGYRRISNFICYYFYKNIVLVFAEIYFVFYSGFSGQPFFPNFLPVLYNFAWTSWQCIFAYSIEIDIQDNTFEEAYSNKLKDKNNLVGKFFEVFPKLYRAGQIKYYFNLQIFWLWLLYAVIHGGLAYLLISYGVSSNSIFGDGKLVDHFYINTIIFSALIHIVTYKIFIEINFWNILVISTAILSIAIYYISILLINTIFISNMVQPELTAKINNMMLSKTFWVYIITLPIFVILFDLFLKFIYRFFYPNPLDLINMNKIVICDHKNIVRRMTVLKESGEKFNRETTLNHLYLQKHPNKTVLEVPLRLNNNCSSINDDWNGYKEKDQNFKEQLIGNSEYINNKSLISNEEEIN